MGPPLWDPAVKDGIQVAKEVFCHDHCPIDCAGYIVQVGADNGNDVLQPLQFLEEEDVQRCPESFVVKFWRTSQLHDLCPEDLLHKVGWHLCQQIQALLFHDLICGLTTA